jgi:hypothetical protein
MNRFITLLIFLFIAIELSAQNDTIYGMNFTQGNLQFASMQISSGTTSLYGNGPVTRDMFQGGVYDFDPINKRYFYARGISNSTQLITINAKTGSILHSPLLTCTTPSVMPITNIAYDWINDTLYGTHHAYENNQTTLRFAKVDINTGVVTIVNNAPISLRPFIAGNTDIDPINGRYFLIDGSSIKTIDIYSGQIISNFSIQFPLNTRGEYLVNIAYNWSDGLVYGIYKYPISSQNPNNSYLKLASIDPSSGKLNVLSQSPLSQDGFVAGDCDIDVIGGRYFYIRQKRLYLVDLASGSLISNQAIQNPNNAISPIINMAYDDLMLPQNNPAALNLADTIFKPAGDSIELDAFVTNNASYMWSNGSNSPKIKVQKPGTYSITIMVDDFEIYGQTTVINTLVSSQEEFQSSLSIYPNPSTGLIHVDFSNEFEGPIKLEIISMEGRTCISRWFDITIGADNLDIDLGDLPVGIYQLYLYAKNRSIHQKILITEDQR